MRSPVDTRQSLVRRSHSTHEHCKDPAGARPRRRGADHGGAGDGRARCCCAGPAARAVRPAPALRHLRLPLAAHAPSPLSCADSSGAPPRIVVPLGVAAKVSLDAVRGAVSRAVAHVRASRAGGALQLLAPALPHLPDAAVAHAVAQSALLSNYAYDKYITSPKWRDIDEIVLAGVPSTFAPQLAAIATLCSWSLRCRRCDSRAQTQPYLRVTWQTSAGTWPLRMSSSGWRMLWLQSTTSACLCCAVRCAQCRRGVTPPRPATARRGSAAAARRGTGVAVRAPAGHAGALRRPRPSRCRAMLRAAAGDAAQTR